MGYFSGYIFGRYLSAAGFGNLSDITNRLSGFVRVYSKNNSISTGYVRCEILENRNNKIVKIESVASLWRHAPVIVFDAKVIYLFDKTKFIAVIFGNPFRVDGRRWSAQRTRHRIFSRFKIRAAPGSPLRVCRYAHFALVGMWGMV